MLGERIHHARLAAGLTLEALGQALGVTKAAIQKYEKGKAVPDSGKLLKIAKACGVRTEYFFRTSTVALSKVEFRKHRAFGAKRTEAAKLRVAAEVEKRVALLSVFPQSPLQGFNAPEVLPTRVANLDDLEDLAESVREHWSLGLNPIADLTDTLESLGFLVLTLDEPHEAFSGMTAWADAAEGRRYPVIVSSSLWPGDRQRFTLAHEFAHVLLEGRLSAGIDEEKACNRFAGAFLAPRSAVLLELGPRRQQLEPQELYHLKLEYGLSMRSWVMRAAQCGVIADAQFRSLMKLFSARGWNRGEPGAQLASEKPQVFEQLIYRALAEQLISEGKAAELIGLPRLVFARQRWMDPVDAAANQ
jgi:Zn-dependent peptidase ImmA (M78 family)/DNA-binding XRE family transcriptional regulator